MKKILLVSTLLAAFLTASKAQNTFSFANSPIADSPEITDSQVTFRIAADYATVVRLTGSWMDDETSSVPMTKENGVWSVTIYRPSPDIYTYSFIVDGVPVNDPGNSLLLREGMHYTSVLMIKGEKSANYFDNDRRGSVEYVWYESPALGLTRRVAVYLPNGYFDKSLFAKRYPVLYLLHAHGGDEESWLTMGRIAQIMDNLIAQGKAEPMVVVMPNCDPNMAASPNLGLAKGDAASRFSSLSTAFAKSLSEEIIPYVEKNFRVVPKAEERAVAGPAGADGSILPSAYARLFSKSYPLADSDKDWPDWRTQISSFVTKIFK